MFLLLWNTIVPGYGEGYTLKNMFTLPNMCACQARNPYSRRCWCYYMLLLPVLYYILNWPIVFTCEYHTILFPGLLGMDICPLLMALGQTSDVWNSYVCFSYGQSYHISIFIRLVKCHVGFCHHLPSFVYKPSHFHLLFETIGLNKPKLDRKHLWKGLHKFP